MGRPRIVITQWRVPFAQIVLGSFELPDDAQAVAFINAASEKWWNENEGQRSCEEGHSEPYTPINDLFDVAAYELWGGEVGFHAMLDEETYWRVHEAHYKKEYDDKGEKRPGYLRAAYGEDVTLEREEVFAAYSVKH